MATARALATSIATSVADEFQKVQFNFKNELYELTTYSLREKIKKEIIESLSDLNFSPTEGAIIVTFPDLAKHVSGSMNTKPNYNVVSREGIETSGLVKQYFELFLDQKVVQFITGMMGLNTAFNFNFTSGRFDYDEEFNRGIRQKQPDRSVCEDLLKTPDARKKAILKTFYKTLVDLATEEQIQSLHGELTDPVNHSPLIKALRTTSTTSWKFWRSSELEDKDRASYKEVAEYVVAKLPKQELKPQ